jgi:hypothetical protein
MPKYIVRSRTEASAETVWPLVSDLTKHGDWSADPLTVTAQPDGTYTSVATSKGREFRATLTVTESVEPTRFAFRAVDATGTYDHVITLAPDGTGTELTREVDAAELSLGQRILFYAVVGAVKKPNAQKALDRLAAAATPGT